MQKETITNAIEELKKNSEKRKFTQTYDLIINLKELDLKKPEQQIDLFIQIPHQKTKKTKICAMVGPELAEAAETLCDKVIMPDDFAAYDKKRKIIKLAKEYDFFIAQVTIMPQIAKVFGRILGTRGKMPNPKAGCVVAPNTNLKPLIEKLQKTIRLSAKTQLSIKTSPGREDMTDEQITENTQTILTSLSQALPDEVQNIKNITLKLTMGKPIELTEKKAKDDKKKK